MNIENQQILKELPGGTTYLVPWLEVLDCTRFPTQQTVKVAQDLRFVRCAIPDEKIGAAWRCHAYECHPKGQQSHEDQPPISSNFWVLTWTPKWPVSPEISLSLAPGGHLGTPSCDLGISFTGSLRRFFKQPVPKECCGSGAPARNSRL